MAKAAEHDEKGGVWQEEIVSEPEKIHPTPQCSKTHGVKVLRAAGRLRANFASCAARGKSATP